MGAVSKLIKDRERRENPRGVSQWDLLWIPATLAYYIACAAILPDAGSRSIGMLSWVAFAVVWVLVVAVAEQLIRRARRRWRRAPAGSPLGPLRGWRFALYLFVCMTAAQIQARGAGLLQLLGLAGAAFGIVLIERGVAAIAQRREAARRRKEVAELARQF